MRTERHSAARARPERVCGVSSMQVISSCVAKYVQLVVLRTLITVVQLTGRGGAEDELWLRDKTDAANFGQRQSSHVVIWDETKLSSGMWVQRTRTLDSLGSNKAMHRVPPLQMAPSGSRCLYCGVGCT